LPQVEGIENVRSERTIGDRIDAGLLSNAALEQNDRGCRVDDTAIIAEGEG
jgi:hypothetical protein